MRRIFIVGFPRSGTTLLQSLLGAHPDIATFPESHLLSRTTIGPFRFFPFVVRKRRMRPFALDFLRHCRCELEPDSDVMKQVRRLDHSLVVSGRAMASVAVSLFDAVALEQGFQAWVEKTPDHLRVWQTISNAVQDVQFVHIARNPLDAVASFHETHKNWSSRTRGPRSIAHRWNRELRRSLTCAGKTNHFFVTYETLARNPYETADRLAAALKLRRVPKFSENYAEVAVRVSTPDETHKSRNLAPISLSRRRTEQLPQELVDAINGVTDRSLYDTFAASSITP